MKPVKPGVEIRPNSIRIYFQYQGERRRERLTIDGQALPPSPANVKYARRIAAEIGDKIRFGIFSYADYFPDSVLAEVKPAPDPIPHLFDVMDLWLRIHELKSSTRTQYRRRMNSFWKKHLKNDPIDQVRYSDILEALTKGTWKSAKSRNNELSMVSGGFELAKHDKHISENPCDAIKRQEVQQTKPDPFTLDEVRLILRHLQEKRPEPIYNFVQLMFFTGLRTSEGLALRWKNIDFRSGEMNVEGGNVFDDEADTTKTSQARTVLLSAPALSALERQKAHTFLNGDHVFHDPKNGRAMEVPYDYGCAEFLGDHT